MRKLSLFSASLMAGLLVVVGGLGASAAQADIGVGNCVPTASVSHVGSTTTARGSAECLIERGNPVIVTVILYIDNWNEGSSSKTCKADAMTPCTAPAVIRNSTSSTYCARTLVNFKTSGNWVARATMTGSCPSYL